MLEESGVNLTPHSGHKIDAFCSTNIDKELYNDKDNLINNRPSNRNLACVIAEYLKN